MNTPEFGFEKVIQMVKDEGQKEYREVCYPYGDMARDAWKGTLQIPNQIISSIIIPAGMQLKMLFLRVWSEYNGTTVFRITQVNPATSGHTGTVEAYPVKGSVPPYTAGLTAVVDYPMLEAQGAEVLGPEPMESPIHVLEGSVHIMIQDPTPSLASDSKFGIAYWGKVD